MTILLHCLQKEFSQEEYSSTLMFLHNSDSHIFLIMEMKGGGGEMWVSDMESCFSSQQAVLLKRINLI